MMLNWIRIQIGIQPKMLDPDPISMNLEPKHCLKVLTSIDSPDAKIWHQSSDESSLFLSDNYGEGVEAAGGCALPRLGRGGAGGAGPSPGPRSAAPQEKKKRGKEEAADQGAGQEEEETETPRSDCGAW